MSKPRDWKPITGVDAARIQSAIDLILSRTNDEIMDVFKENGVPANEWMPRLIQTMLSAAAAGVKLTAKQVGIEYSREMWRDFALEIWDGMDKILADQAAKDRA